LEFQYLDLRGGFVEFSTMPELDVDRARTEALAGQLFRTLAVAARAWGRDNPYVALNALAMVSAAIIIDGDEDAALGFFIKALLRNLE
jgi:hypothetical protein